MSVGQNAYVEVNVVEGMLGRVLYVVLYVELLIGLRTGMLGCVWMGMLGNVCVRMEVCWGVCGGEC